MGGLLAIGGGLVHAPNAGRQRQEFRHQLSKVSATMRNTLFYGDNLDIMREHIADESVDLIYLDPPFNSARDYNVLFKQAKRDENQAQIAAFSDTWQWSKRRYEEFFDDSGNSELFNLVESLYRILGQSEMMAYLVMMAPRLMDIRRVLTRTGSVCLHCDPIASHYLKVMLDVVFGPRSFRNEIIWKRTTSHGNVVNKHGWIHDTILWYTKSNRWTWNQQYSEYDPAYIDSTYRFVEKNTGRRYTLDNITAPMSRASRGQIYEWKGYRPGPSRCWVYATEKMEELDRQGRLHYTKTGGVRYIRYLDEMPGTKTQDIWTDIPIAARNESLGYPTQKPLALLERILKASSNPDDVVLDPFCGCGTAVVAAEKLGRKWMGIDITFIAIDLMISRLAKDFGLKRGHDYDVIGDPKDAYSARKLFEESPKQFEIWAIGLVAGVPQPEKSADRGVDGKVYFMDLEGNLQWAVCQVKGGHLTPTVIRDLSHVIQRDKAAMGFFICLGTPTRGMYQEAEELGFFEAPSGRKIPKLQIRTIEQLLEGKEFDYPKGYSLKSGGKRLAREGEQTELGLE
ncbi:MAG: DNA methyltransferase [Armatimonadota bacterium]|nr:DNA methyltransferase [Armatimonadota bacterium]